MARRYTRELALCACVIFSSLCLPDPARSEDDSETRRQLRELQIQNKALQEQLRKQQDLIDSLSRKVGDIQAADQRRSVEMERLRAEAKGTAESGGKPGSFSLGNVNLSGE